MVAWGTLDARETERDVVTIARALTGCETASIDLCAGPAATLTAFCTHVIRTAAPLVVPDATRDPRFADDPLVTASPHVRFYAGTPIAAADGLILGCLGVCDPRPREAFEQGEALAALARQVAARLADRRGPDLDRLWTLAHDLFLICDLEGTVVAANPAWNAIFGPLPEQGGVRMRTFLVDPEARPDLAAIPDGAAHAVTLDYRGSSGGSHTISWTLSREGETIYGIGRDDTALRAAEREVVQSQKMEALGQLTGGIAHDFNNLLTIIIGNLDIAGRRLERGDLDRVRRALSEAGDGATRAATLTQRLLAFARRQRLAPRALAPTTLLADMRTLIEGAASEAVTVEILVEGGVWSIEADPGQLENAIINLATNARDAMAGLDVPGRLTIGAANARIDTDEGRRQGAAPGDYVRITVADIGTGMSQAVLAHALEPFFTTRGVGKGSGLGLSQVDGFVRQSGGFVTIDSTLGQGTAVHLWLPRSAGTPSEPAMVAELGPDAPRPASIMVVEDNDGLRELIVETLRDAGYRVIEAHDGRAALSLFARQSPPPELVLSDVMMPALDGFQLAAEIRARAPATRVLLMSGYAGAHMAGEPVPLLKPFTTATLLAQVRSVMEVQA